MLTKDEINKAKELLTKQTGAIGSEYHLGTYLLECSKLVPKLLDTVERQAEAIEVFNEISFYTSCSACEENHMIKQEANTILEGKEWITSKCFWKIIA